MDICLGMVNNTGTSGYFHDYGIFDQCASIPQSINRIHSKSLQNAIIGQRGANHANNPHNLYYKALIYENYVLTFDPAAVLLSMEGLYC